MSQNGRLRRIGAMWKPREGAKSLGTGSITVNGLRQRFVVLRNDRKQKASEPDYVLMSSDEPELDQYAAASGSSRPTAPAAPPALEPTTAPAALLEDDGFPF